MSDSPGALRFELASSDRAAFEARTLVKERLAGQLSAPLLDDLLLVVTELVTNSVRHGPGHAIAVELAVSSFEGVTGEVRDDGAATAAQQVADTGREVSGGFGLMLVDRLSRRWGVRPGSTHVWFELAPDSAT